MAFADSTVWVDYLRRSPTPQASLLGELLGGTSIEMGDLILAEVLQGVSPEERVPRIAMLLLARPMHRMVSPAIALAAAANYRTLRRRGRTVRSTIDCLIATYCIENGIELLHSDRDFDPFEEHLGLRVIHP